MDNTEAADKCIKTGFYINHAQYMPEKYTPQLRITNASIAKPMATSHLSANTNQHAENAVATTLQGNATV